MQVLLTAALVFFTLQLAATRQVTVRHDGKPVAQAELTCGPARAVTDGRGRASIAVPPGGCTLVISKSGLSPVTVPITPGDAPITVTLEELPEVEESIVVTATRSGRLAADQALRVEIVGREEIEEKLLMTPGDIAMLLNEMSGLRLQATSPALGTASVRVQGLTGRYAAVLTDGLPINSTQASALGLLQVPPMDLKQVEVIKGAASALYGAAALGGVINLVSRTPGEMHEAEALFNVTSRAGTDSVLWLSGPAGGRRGYTLLAGAHTQNADDVDADGWADLPRYRRVLARPRFVQTGDNRHFEITGGLLHERRTGGAIGVPDGIQSVETWRRDAGAAFRYTTGASVIVARGAASIISHDHAFGPKAYHDRHDALFGEVSVSRTAGAHAIVVGGAVDRQAYRSTDLPSFDYGWTTPGVFVQDDWSVHPRWSISASGRIDRHPRYGVVGSPRVSSLVRLGRWNLRASFGAGFFAPTFLTEETDEVGLFAVDVPADLVAERGRTGSIDLTGRVGALNLSVTLFAARIASPLAVDAVGDRLVLSNRAGPTRSAGAEVFARWHSGPWVVTASHVWTRVTELSRDGSREPSPLTPRRTWSVVAAWERHGNARVGIEIYRTGRQRLRDNPYLADSPGYTIFGVLAERRFGRIRAFVNVENLTNVRLSRTHPLLLPAPSPTGRRTVDAWAPLEGRNINGGARVRF
jgi:iron complex outermembrane receptor protein